MKKRIAHLTSAHPRHDIRILLKECASLAKAGFEVFMVVADGAGDEEKVGVQLLDLGHRGGRWSRFFIMPWKVWAKARKLNADIYQFHDPELLIVGLLLRLEGFRVIYDSHEDLPRQIYSKHYIPLWLRNVISFCVEIFENFVSRRLIAVVTATPHIGKRFSHINRTVVVVNNYPLEQEIVAKSLRKRDPKQICYTGGITRVRGALEMVRALQGLDVKLVMAGPMENQQLKSELESTPGWENVCYLGSVERARVFEVMETSSLGFLLYHPEPNHTDAQPNKLFEYMAVGLPVLASHFDLWRSIVEGYDAGVCVDPQNVDEIRKGLLKILESEKNIENMGERGRNAVEAHLNWGSEEKKLVQLYQSILERGVR
ncbi:glycosyltransferase [Bdellovibrio sp. BCCA]|uniref:glycosyltransferase n=1 Tax=Bdellovibrio sp. BCCA TaxID=3136281 RepID=UPI0030F1BBD5